MGAPALTSHTVRLDYKEHDAWTWAETGVFADGVTASTVRRWYRKPIPVTVGSRTTLHRAFRLKAMGRARVDAASFVKWRETGIPQGEVQ